MVEILDEKSNKNCCFAPPENFYLQDAWLIGAHKFFCFQDQNGNVSIFIGIEEMASTVAAWLKKIKQNEDVCDLETLEIERCGKKGKSARYFDRINGARIYEERYTLSKDGKRQFFVAIEERLCGDKIENEGGRYALNGFNATSFLNSIRFF
ncbi:MAG: hypothetical protein IJX87_04000 [Clostridia bacterium]|nr:hypothetical protein [Clostridia bacterium]